MTHIETKITVTITQANGSETALSETKLFSTTDNPRYFAEAAYMSGEELAARMRSMLESRFGVKPEGMPAAIIR